MFSVYNFQFFDRQRLFTTIFNPTRLANGEGSTLGTLIFDIELVSIKHLQNWPSNFPTGITLLESGLTKWQNSMSLPTPRLSGQSSPTIWALLENDSGSLYCLWVFAWINYLMTTLPNIYIYIYLMAICMKKDDNLVFHWSSKL